MKVRFTPTGDRHLLSVVAYSGGATRRCSTVPQPVRERGASALGTKTEIKNMNAFSLVERALEVEFARQVAILESGGSVQQ